MSDHDPCRCGPVAIKACRHCKRPMRAFERRPDVHYCPHCDRMPEEP